MSALERDAKWLGVRGSAVLGLVWIYVAWILSQYTGMHRAYLASLAFLPAVLVHVSLTYPSLAPLARNSPLVLGASYLVCAVPAAIGLRAAVGSPETESVLRAATLGLSALACALLLANLVRAASPREAARDRFAARIGLAGLAVSIASLIAISRWPEASIGVAAFPIALVLGATWTGFGDARASRVPEPEGARERSAITLEQIGVELAHSMRKPLEAVSNQLEESMRSISDPNEQRRLKESVELLGQMHHLIEGVLDLARGQSKPRARRLRLETLLDQAVEEVRRRFPEAVIQSKPVEGFVQGDEVTLRCVIVNLLENALEASTERPWARISAERSAQWCEIAVEDQAGGLPDVVRAHLFEPFITTKPRGIGLGLTTVREACLAHGGQIAAEEIPNGTRFVVRLPIQAG